MTDLEQAIEAIYEGGQSLGVSCEDVYRKMLANEGMMLDIMKGIHGRDETVSDAFDFAFTAYAESMLKEAKETKEL